MAPTHPAAQRSKAFGQPQQSWPERLRSNWPILALVAAWGLVNVIVLWPPDATDREYYDAYIAAWRGIEQFRTSEDRDQRWSEFSSEQLAELEPILADLEADASPEEPIKQQLLWAGRDYLIPILRGKRGIDEDQLRDYMDRIRGRLLKRGFDVEPMIREEPEEEADGADTEE